MNTVYGVLAWNNMICFLTNGKLSPAAAFDLGFPIRSRLALHAVQSKHALQKLCKSFRHPHLGPSTDTVVPRVLGNHIFPALRQFTAQRRRGPGRSKGVCMRRPFQQRKSNDEGSPASSKRSVSRVKTSLYEVRAAKPRTFRKERHQDQEQLLYYCSHPTCLHAAAEALSTHSRQWHGPTRHQRWPLDCSST
ncbi:hypothetical protein BDP81DRAFT_30799 [Colletotrichum phormii]|uniref:Uncharacterized protein n=1 Tax=Colletotrichum phormii TaxID=359342 RepID=A0AAI9ZTY1_9PEZI|nr:uncharacterized protein BDP81DRAFT_30799 [Colletotrichum phormii]KAK1636918.1 hypothetical protein BDP81DRAFT_30799 [Colletotrichum phormii]